MSFVLVVGLLGGAGYAGWYKFIRQDVVWSNELQSTAEFVEANVHRSFEATVPVVTLAPPEYEVELGLVALRRLDPADSGTTDLLDLRAVGLVIGQPPAAVVGHLLAPSTTSFYDGAHRSIYRLDGVTPLFEVGLVRSMTLALIDQHAHYTAKMPTLSPAQRAGYWALIDGITAKIVATKRQLEPDAGSEAAELQARRDAAGSGGSGLPWYLSAIVGSGEVEAAPLASASAGDPLKGLAPPPSDAVVFDPGADASLSAVAAADPAAAAPGTSVAQAQGMEFWYEALAPVIGVEQARAAALLWSGDASFTNVINGQACIQSTIATASAANQAALLGALTGWVRSRPASSTASVAAATDGTPSVTLSMCEPAEAQPEPSGSIDDMRSFFERALTERAVLDRVTQLGAPGQPVSAPCVVAAFRNGAVAAFDVASTDPALVTTLTNVAAFCKG
jgi:hypothetical protein